MVYIRQSTGESSRKPISFFGLKMATVVFPTTKVKRTKRHLAKSEVSILRANYLGKYKSRLKILQFFMTLKNHLQRIVLLCGLHPTLALNPPLTLATSWAPKSCSRNVILPNFCTSSEWVTLSRSFELTISLDISSCWPNSLLSLLLASWKNKITTRVNSIKLLQL